MKRQFAKYGIDLEYAVSLYFRPNMGHGRLRELDDVPSNGTRGAFLYWGLFILIAGGAIFLPINLNLPSGIAVSIGIFGLFFSLFYLPVMVFRRTVARKSIIYKRVEQELLSKQGIKE
jgi:hypothetical protein